MGVGTLYPKLPPGPHPDADERTIASNQRARLYGAMIELAGTRGYEACTVGELCALAGVSKRTLYDRFPGGKEACLLATYDVIVRHAHTHILGRGTRRIDTLAAMSQRRRFVALVEAFAAEVAVYPKAARLALLEAPEVGGAALERTEATKRLLERVVCWCLREDRNASSARARVRAVVDEGGLLLRARLGDGRLGDGCLEGLAQELVHVCLDRAGLAGASGERPSGQRAGAG